MATITVEDKFFNILEKYISDEQLNALEELKKFSNEEFIFKIKFNKYKSCINAPAAKTIVDFQNAIYRIVALSLRGKADARLLSKKIKDDLEIPFKISESSTIQETKDLLKTTKGILEMIPEEHRAFVLVSVVALFFIYSGWLKYLNKEKENDKNKLIEKALDKLAEANSTIASIVKKTIKDVLSSLIDVDDNMEIQGESCSKEALQEIKKRMFPTKKQEPKIKTIEGIFKINTIELKKDYLIVEDPDCNSDPLRIYYDKDSLLSVMQDLKEQLKNAIDNEDKTFFIKAGYAEKNGKKETILLFEIKENKG